MNRLLAALGCAALLAACAQLAPPPEEHQSIFLLEAPSTADVPHPKTGPILEVATPRAYAGFETDRMAYTRRSDEIEYFSRNRWADTPARMLAPVLLQAIERSGAFRAVVREPSAIHVDLRLETELIRLQQNFAFQPSRVQIAVRVLLVTTTSDATLAIAQFDESEAAASDDPYGGVVAANHALSRLVARIADFCAAQASQP